MIPGQPIPTPEEEAIARGYRPEVVAQMDRAQLVRALSIEQGIEKHTAEIDAMPKGPPAESRKDIRQRVERRHLALQRVHAEGGNGHAT